MNKLMTAVALAIALPGVAHAQAAPAEKPKMECCEKMKEKCACCDKMAGKLQEKYGWTKDEADRQVSDWERRQGDLGRRTHTEGPSNTSSHLSIRSVFCRSGSTRPPIR